MTDAFWSGLFSNGAAIITAIGTFVTLIFTLYNGRKLKSVEKTVDAGVVQRNVQGAQLNEVKSTVDKTKRLADSLQQDQAFLKTAMQTNTMASNDIKVMMEKYVSGFGVLK